MRLLVIDGNSIANRAFYGIKLLTTKDGRYTNAIFGFLNIMNSLLRECEPDEVAVAFDLKHPTFRHEMYDGYKYPPRHAGRAGPADAHPERTAHRPGLPPGIGKAGRPTTFWARWPLPARPAGTTAFWPRETATACSW